MKKERPLPWKELDEYRGKDFEGMYPSLAQLFEMSCRKYSDRKCFECFVPKHVQFTYSQAHEIVHNIASYLVSIGVKKGERIALTGKNSPYWALSYLGIVSMGAVVTTVDYALKDEEIRHLVDYVEIKGIFADEERLESIAGDRYGFKIALESVESLPKTDLPYELPTASDMAAFLFTSGTTGIPKAVMLSHENLVSDFYSARYYMHISCDDVFYALLPIHHVYTMLACFIAPMGCGAATVFGKKLVVSQIFKDFKNGKVTMFMAVPLLYNKLAKGIMKGVEEKGKLASFVIKAMMRFSGFVKKTFNVNPGKKMFGFLLKKVSLENMRVCICGAGPLPPETFRQFNQLGVDFVQGYGLTETSPILTLNPVDDYEEASIGKPLPFVEMKFINKDENGNGEIAVRGPMVMKGYYKNEEATSEVFDEEGYFKTGDVGYQDERGFVYLTGRAKNIIVTEGGKNVFPEEIEDHFQLYDQVEEICIVGYLADREKKSEGICAIIYPNREWAKSVDDVHKSLENICEEVNRDLLPYKRIRKIIISDEHLPMTTTKKVKRFELIKLYKQELS